MSTRAPNARTQVEGELAEIRYTIRQREMHHAGRVARNEPLRAEHQRGLERLRAIETRLQAILQDLIDTHEIERAEQLSQGVG